MWLLAEPKIDFYLYSDEFVLADLNDLIVCYGRRNDFCIIGVKHTNNKLIILKFILKNSNSAEHLIGVVLQQNLRLRAHLLKSNVCNIHKNLSHFVHPVYYILTYIKQVTRIKICVF